ncbi:MAG TPA: 50S ribosomal protein L11 methyltransferase [Thermoanaerobaculia bacterium]|nr:50S ribosomal protein L11 methyltransferase [Thermoanaerobaculia bacterium]
MLDYHRTLLADEIRMAALRAAIARVVRRGDVVVDLGCGTGILSFLALDAGAKRVYAIDQGHLADVASFLGRHLGFHDRLTVFHDLSTNVDLPERADVLLTETIGAAGLDENIVGFVLDAKKRFLRDGAAMIPRAIALHAAPVDVAAIHERSVGFWTNANLGYDFSPVRVFASNAMQLVEIGEDKQLALDAQLVQLDLASLETTLVNGDAHFVATRDGVVHGFALWFHAVLAEDIVLTNRVPKATSWAQAFLPLDVPVAISRGVQIALDLQTDDGKAWRWRGTIDGATFDQMTVLNRPPCIRHD